MSPELHPYQRRKLHDVNILDQLIPEAGAFYVMDRGYIDFKRLYRLHQAGSFFVTRAKRDMVAKRRYSRPTDRSTGVMFEQTLFLKGLQTAKDYRQTLRGIRYKDPETGKRVLFISNNTALPVLVPPRANELATVPERFRQASINVHAVYRVPR